MEVDLASPVKKRVWIQDHWHDVEFESLNLICFACHQYKHVSSDCCFQKQEAMIVVQGQVLEVIQPQLNVEEVLNQFQNLKLSKNKGDVKDLGIDGDHNWDWCVVKSIHNQNCKNKGKKCCAI